MNDSTISVCSRPVRMPGLQPEFLSPRPEDSESATQTRPTPPGSGVPAGRLQKSLRSALMKSPRPLLATFDGSFGLTSPHDRAEPHRPDSHRWAPPCKSRSAPGSEPEAAR